MNALDKIAKALDGLTHCKSYCDRSCPYYDETGCRDVIASDAFDVITALKAELEKRTNKSDEKKPGFITLTAGIIYNSDMRQVLIEGKGKVAIRVDEIFAVSDLVDVKGSEVWLNNAQQTKFYVCETIEEILGKIAKGEEE